MTKKIGFACKWIDTVDQITGIKATDAAKKYNTGTTTVAWLSRQTQEVAEQKLWDLMVQNIEATYQLIIRVGNQLPTLRMVRISSDLLPCYTHPNWQSFWKRPDVIKYAETYFGKVGRMARYNDVKLSFHPGQFCVLASTDAGIVDRSIAEFEYHADMVRWMGYGETFQDFKINVHISGRQGPDGIRSAYKRLSPEARNCITIENEELTHGLAECLTLSDICPIVLDIHHNWLREGEYILPTDLRVQQVVESWRDVRPTMHYSISREDILVNHDTNVMPDKNLLLSTGYKKGKLRAHSNFYWNTPVNDWALSFWDQFDIMSECKSKNLGSFKLFEYAKSCNLI
jgi:UV DNA damage endonuclease